MKKRRILSKHLSKRVFRKGTKVNRKNAMGGAVVMRGGIRL